MQDSYKDMAQRIVNAEDKFISMVVERYGKTKEQAAKILAVFKKYKLIDISVGTGQHMVKHGGLLDKRIMDRALDIAEGRVK